MKSSVTKVFQMRSTDWPRIRWSVPGQYGQNTSVIMDDTTLGMLLLFYSRSSLLIASYTLVTGGDMLSS